MEFIAEKLGMNTVFNVWHKKTVKGARFGQVKDSCRFFPQLHAKVVFVPVLNHLKLLSPFLEQRVLGKFRAIRKT
jgi:hypothetical protein